MTNNPLMCNADDSALVIIDIQTKLTSVMPMKVLARLQRNSALLCKAAELLNVPILASEQYPKGLGQLEPEIVKLLSEDSTVIDKTSFSCMRHQGFSEALKESGRKQIILIGMESHICILQTALDLVNDGYSVFVVSDAVCSRHRENYETSIQRMRNCGITICDSESVVFEWLKDAKNENFKVIADIIK